MAKQRLDATITIGSVLERSVGKNLNIIRRGLDGVGDEIKKVTDRQRELSKQRKVLERQGDSVDALDREYEQLGRTLDDLRRKQERFERAQGAANRVGRQFGEVNRQIGRTARNAGIAIGAASAAAFGLASSTAAAGDELAKQSRALGFGVEAYQELGYAAERSGVSAEVFNSSMTAMTKRLGEAAQGQGAAKKALDELGLSAQDLIEMEPDQALGVIADRMKDIDDPARKAALAAALFSRSGIRMTNMLNEGSAGIDALRNRARELGLVLSEETTTDSENFQDSLLNAQSALQGMKNIIGGEMIPVVGEMMDAFTEFVVTNQPQIREFAETLANGLRDAVPIIGEVVSGLGDFAGKVGSVVSKVAEMIGGWENFGIALGVLMTSPSIVAVGGFVVTVGKLAIALKALASASLLPAITAKVTALGTAIAATPIGFLIAGAASVAAGAYLIYKNWDGVKDFFGDLFGSVIDTLGGFGQFVGGIFTGNLTSAVDGIKQSWQGWRDTTATILNGIGATFTAAWTDLIKPVTDKLGVTEPIVAGWNAARDGIGAAVNFVGEKLTAFKDAVVTPFVEYMSNIDISAAWEGIKTAIGGVLDWMGAKFDWVLEKIKPVLNALSWVGDQGAAAVGAVTGFFGGDGQVSGGSSDRLTQRAIGGSFPANMPTLVGERGPELIYPNQGGFVAHNRALERMAAMSKMIGGGEAANDNGTPAFGRLASEIGGMGRAVAAAVGAMMLTVSAPEPAIAIPAPVVTINQPAPEQSAPAAQQVIERAAPAINFAPVFDPIIEQAAPVVEQQLPPGVTVDPVINVAVPEMASPFVEVAAPIVQMAAPILERVMPVMQRAAPAPMVGQAMPAQPAPLVNVAAPQVMPVMQQAAPVQMLDFTPQAAEPIPEPAIQPAPAIRQEGARSASVVQNITINAPQNMDVQQLVAELERLKSLAQNDALFDGANDWGQYA